MTETTFSIETAWTWTVEYAARDSTALAHGNGHASDSAEDQNIRNAIAHAHTSALLAFDLTSAVANAGGKLKELIPGGDIPADIYRDEYNNEVGRRIAEFARDNNLSKADIDDLIIDALNEGRLITDLNDSRIINETPPDWEEPSNGWEGVSLGRDYTGLIGPDIDLNTGPSDIDGDGRPDGIFPAPPPPPGPVFPFDPVDPEQLPKPKSPLVFDLDQDGIELSALGDQEIYFDFDGNGQRELTGWVNADDGLLALDINENRPD